MPEILNDLEALVSHREKEKINRQEDGFVSYPLLRLSSALLTYIDVVIPKNPLWELEDWPRG
jgi:hypothetical protein